jgi:hypothetical protein
MKEFILLKMTHWVEGKNFGDADFECELDCKKMGKVNKDDSDDSHSMEKACMMTKNCSLH